MTVSRPLVRVAKAQLRQGGMMLAPGRKCSWWELTLECGHVVERNIRWKPSGGRVVRGWGTQWNPPSLNRLPEPPRSARCEDCPS